MTAVARAAPRRSPSRRVLLDRLLLYGAATFLALWTLVPIYLIAVAAFSERGAVYDYPKELLPTRFSTDTMAFFVGSSGVISSVKNSVIVALGTIVLSLAIGAPAGYALSRFRFPGRDVFQLAVLSSKMFPMAILAIPLAVTFIGLGLYDTFLGGVIGHIPIFLPRGFS